MLKLNDGRSELWQWDTGRKLIVGAECSQVHFSNKVFGRSIDVDVVDGVASIPDILLQTDKELTAWAFVGTPENGYTKISKVFKVNRRNKPADYVFTPTEQTTLEEIKERLGDLEATQDPDAIKSAIDEALQEAKESGEFKGEKGSPGEPGPEGPQGIQGENGKDGVSVTHEWQGTVLSVTSASGTTSVDLKGEKGDPGEPGADGAKGDSGPQGEQGIRGEKGEKGDKGDTGATGAQGNPGKDGAPGKDGTSASHSWNGTVLTVTSASGTSSADLKGAKGDKGDQGEPGQKGDKGDPGATGSPGPAGKTPVFGVDYWTEADQESIVQQVITALGTPVFGTVDADNNIILTGDLLDGTYTVKYEDADGNVVDVGVLNHLRYINQIPISTDASGNVYNTTGYKNGVRLNTSAVETAAEGMGVTGFIPCKPNDILYFSDIATKGTNSTGWYKLQFFDENKSSTGHAFFYNNDGSQNYIGNTANINAGYVAQDGNGYITKIKLAVYNSANGTGIQANSGTISSNFRYVRVVCGTISNNSIVTVNQPIE